MLMEGADGRRWRGLLALTLVMLGLHGLLLGGVRRDGLASRSPTAAPALQVRTLQAPGSAEMRPALPAAPAPAPVARPVRHEKLEQASAAMASETPDASLGRGRTEPEPPVEPEPPEPPEPHEPSTVLAAAPALPAVAAEPGDAESRPPPLYSTRLPPAVTLRYELRRGVMSGSGELLWRPEAGRYALTLQGTVLGLNALTQESRGVLDAHGLAPERFTDQRLRRAMVAANFERAAGRIRFSGPSVVLPWHPGVQDRLSWMIQLGAIVAAEPARAAVGERVVLEVVGARGDASLWVFRSLGSEALMLAGERIDTVHLLRESLQPYDTRVEVWLATARHHLPVRATTSSGSDGAFELRLRETLP